MLNSTSAVSDCHDLHPIRRHTNHSSSTYSKYMVTIIYPSGGTLFLCYLQMIFVSQNGRVIILHRPMDRHVVKLLSWVNYGRITNWGDSLLSLLLSPRNYSFYSIQFCKHHFAYRDIYSRILGTISPAKHVLRSRYCPPEIASSKNMLISQLRHSRQNQSYPTSDVGYVPMLSCYELLWLHYCVRKL